jgi:hypothetical protein
MRRTRSRAGTSSISLTVSPMRLSALPQQHVLLDIDRHIGAEQMIGMSNLA